MKKINVLFYSALIFLSFSCEKKITQKEIDIKYKLTDDVSPVKVVFSVEGDFRSAVWFFNDIYISEPHEINTAECVFGNGKAKVEFEAYSNRIKYFGEKEIEINLEIATKLEISGIFFKSSEDLIPFLNKEYIIKFALYNGVEYKYTSRTINLTELSTNDTLFFTDPVIYDIKGFNDTNSNYFINVTINDLADKTLIFRGNFYINDNYYFERNLLMGKIQLSSFPNTPGIKTLFLKSDWKP